MTIQQSLFPVLDAYNEIKDYITCKGLSVRYTQPCADMVMVHLHPSDDLDYKGDVNYFLMEQADMYADDFAEWLPHLTVRYGERDDDWYIITITQ